MRFIDLASDGGCSKKADAGSLKSLLGSVAQRVGGQSLKAVADGFPDVGNYTLPSPRAFATVDIVFPMIDDARDFGRIAANHALNDIYAALASPQFALAIVGVPSSMEADDHQIIEMLAAAAAELGSANVSIIGGHTLAKQSDLFLGFTVIGSPIEAVPTAPAPEPGDFIVLTKKLGTNVAASIWKSQAGRGADFQDVRAGMLQSASEAARICVRNGVSYCTDVSGFGLVNHLHLLLKRAAIDGRVNINSLPIYSSIRHLGCDLPFTGQFYRNMDFASRSVDLDGYRSHELISVAIDGQVAGGLLFLCKKERLESLLVEMSAAQVDASVIGVCKGPGSGNIEFFE